MAKRKKTEMLFVRADERLKSRIEAAADVLESDMSQFIRDAIIEKLDRLISENQKVAKALRAVAA